MICGRPSTGRASQVLPDNHRTNSEIYAIFLTSLMFGDLKRMNKKIDTTVRHLRTLENICTNVVFWGFDLGARRGQTDRLTDA